MSHAKFAPSAAERWLACPGSVALCAGKESPENDYSREGTAGHLLASWCIANDFCHPDDVNEVLGAGMPKGWTKARAQKELGEAVEVYIEGLRYLQLAEPFAWQLPETRLEILPGLCWGTGDFLARQSHILYVADLKLGAGKFVSEKGNPQLRIYGLGALRTFQVMTAGVTEIRLGICQPRFAGAEAWRWDTTTPTELETWGSTHVDATIDKARRLKAGAGLRAGDHCKWCPAAAECPELRNASLALAKSAFAPVSADKRPLPTNFSNDELAELLPKLPMVEEWIERVKAEAHHRASHGAAIPGHKLVAKRANRKWRDEAEAVRALVAAGVDAYDAPSVVSPAEAERRAKGNAPLLKSLDKLTHRPETGTALVPSSDTRPEVPSGAACFIKHD